MAEQKSKKGVGIALLAAAAAAGYFLYGRHGAKNRKKIRGWMLKAKGEVLERIEKLKDIDEEKYFSILEKVGTKYEKMKDVDAEDVEKLMSELRKHWRAIQKDIEPKKKTAVRGAKKAIHAAATKIARVTDEKETSKRRGVSSRRGQGSRGE